MEVIKPGWTNDVCTADGRRLSQPPIVKSPFACSDSYRALRFWQKPGINQSRENKLTTKEPLSRNAAMCVILAMGPWWPVQLCQRTNSP